MSEKEIGRLVVVFVAGLLTVGIIGMRSCYQNKEARIQQCARRGGSWTGLNGVAAVGCYRVTFTLIDSVETWR